MAKIERLTKERLDEMKLSEADRKAYNAYLGRLRNLASEEYNKMIDTKELIDKAVESEKIKSIKKALKRGKLTLEEIAEDFEVSIAYVRKLQEI